MDEIKEQVPVRSAVIFTVTDMVIASTPRGRKCAPYASIMARLFNRLQGTIVTQQHRFIMEGWGNNFNALMVMDMITLLHDEGMCVHEGFILSNLICTNKFCREVRKMGIPDRSNIKPIDMSTIEKYGWPPKIPYIPDVEMWRAVA